MRRFIGIDGEGWSVETGSNPTDEMTLLGASDGSYLYNENGLDFFVCIDYLLNLKVKYPDAIFVSYCSSWDCTHILKTFEEKARRELIYTNCVNINYPGNEDLCYRVEYLAGKWLTISLRYIKNGRYHTAMTFTMYDIFGFFGESFVNAAVTMRCLTTEELQLLIAGKSKRKEFGHEMLDFIQEYNLMECQLMAKIASQLDCYLLKHGIKISKWHGPGAIATKVLGKAKVKEHILPIETGSDFETAVMSAYFGGRAQAVKVGPFRLRYNGAYEKREQSSKPYWGYDINSAYPFALADLPSMECAEIVRVAKYEPMFNTALYKVSWNIPDNSPFGPLPFRMPNGSIDFPASGTGWYWKQELDSAANAFGAGCFVILDGYIITANDNCKPFGFLRDLYDNRQELQRNGDPSEIVLKMAMNSVYGKLAQSVTYYENESGYQSYIYAGIATAITRAKLLDATASNKESVIEFCTDGILCTDPLPVYISGDLGAWKCGPIESMFVIKSGVHRVTFEDSEAIACRGFKPDELDWKQLELLWFKSGPAGQVSFRGEQFQSLAMDAGRPGRWDDIPKRLDFWPRRGCPMQSKISHVYNIEPLHMSGESTPYDPVKFVNIEQGAAILESETVYNIVGA